jgi:xanthine/uracil permease
MAISVTGKELLRLVAAVIAIDAGFILIYFLGHVSTGSDTAKLTFTAVWTLAVLIIALRGLARIRSARLKPAAKGRSS